ncbi:MAG: hypothetical protein ABL986_11170 [Vicinamibacterales bacterium]
MRVKGRMHLARAAALVLAAVVGAATPAHAQQTFNLTLGGFVPNGQDARESGDVLTANHEYLVFDFKDFNNATVGGEWLVAAGPFVEFGAGLSFYRRTVPTVYRDYIASDRSEIEQSLKLRLVPVTFTARLVPTGQSSPIQPYVGAGVALVNWRYSEFGDFVDFGSPSLVVRPGTFVANGTEVAPVVLGGVRLAGDVITFGGEVRYQKAAADLGNEFAGPKLDLGGWTYQATLGIRFGR